MRLFVLLAVALLAVAAFGQQRQDSFDTSAATVTEVVARPLPDGGCEARWCAEVTSSDGGTTITSCTAEFVELKATVNQNRCAGLASAGLNRVLRQLRFDVDAGSQ